MNKIFSAMQKVELNKANNKCTCDQFQPTHSCPYASELRDDDSEDYCSCCPYCRRQCAEDV